jgi:hypothetical protein
MTSAYPLVKLMTAPDTAATVLYDFNIEDGLTPLRRCRVEQDDFSVGVPALQGDPDSIFPQYGPRTVAFSVQVWGPKSYALGKVSAAARWLLRDNSWLMVQLSASMKPVWFKLYRPEPGALSFDHVDKTDTKDVWRWTVSLPAEPFAYGAKVSIPQFTITNNPISGTNKCFYQLPTILGDAPAPLTLDILPSSGTTWTGGRALIASAAIDPSLSYTGPIVWQASAFTAGTDTGAAVATNPLYFGTGYREVSFTTTATAATRISGNAPTTPPAGRFSVYARVGRSDTSSKFQMRLGQNYGLGQTTWGDYAVFDRATSPAVDHAVWVPLGDFTFPLGADLGANLGTVSTPSISLEMSRTSGTGAARINGFILVPVGLSASYDSRQLLAYFPGFGIDNNRNGVWDADRESFRGYESGTSVSQGIVPQMQGRFPTVHPGLTNLLHLLHQTYPSTPLFTGNSNADDITATHLVKASYYPKWLLIGDGT